MNFKFLKPKEYILNFIYENGIDKLNMDFKNIILEELTWLELFIYLFENDLFMENIKYFLISQFYYYLNKIKNKPLNYNKIRFLISFENDLYHKNNEVKEIINKKIFIIDKIDKIIEDSFKNEIEYNYFYFNECNFNEMLDINNENNKNLKNLIKSDKELINKLNENKDKSDILIKENFSDYKIKYQNSWKIFKESDKFWIYRIFLILNYNIINKKNHINLSSVIISKFNEFTNNNNIKIENIQINKLNIIKKSKFKHKDKDIIFQEGQKLRYKIKIIFKAFDKFNINMYDKEKIMEEVKLNKINKVKLSIKELSTKININAKIINKYLKIIHKINMIKSKNKNLIDELYYYNFISSVENFEHYINPYANPFFKTFDNIYKTYNSNEDKKIQSYFKKTNKKKNKNNFSDKNNYKNNIDNNEDKINSSYSSIHSDDLYDIFNILEEDKIKINSYGELKMSNFKSNSNINFNFNIDIIKNKINN